MRVPDAHDQPPLPLPKPVGHHGDHTRPAGGLEHAAGHLDEDEVP